MVTVSRTLRSASSPPTCCTAPTFPWATAARGRSPHTLTSPEVGSLMPSTMSSRVVFPAPFGPSRATTPPRGISSETPCTARTVSERVRKVLTASCTWMAGEWGCGGCVVFMSPDSRATGQR